MAWTSPRTWAAAETVTAALFNVGIRDNLKAIGDAWTAYTPVWTSGGTAPVLGNGTLTGKWMQAGKLTVYQFTLTAGSTTTFGTGAWYFSSPFTAATLRAPAGAFTCWDNSAAVVRSNRVAYFATTTTIGAQDDAGGHVAATNPFAWATSDALIGSGTYEAV